MTTSDLDQARAVLDRHFYSNFIDVLSPAAGWRARFDVMPAGAVMLGDLNFGADVRIDFGELGAYHVDIPIAGRLVWHQGGAQPVVADLNSAAVFNLSATPFSTGGRPTAGSSRSRSTRSLWRTLSRPCWTVRSPRRSGSSRGSTCPAGWDPAGCAWSN
ncbi:hypothetical protein [Paractinoplanes globisporus]|uniref:AraC-like ligand-binding domain-containing protein n=1 Tax=Paractinoplanes globisporus TaxID=113565 RepID=UPI0024800A32|nr:hypothetical protein [Actinoplanes globisporus]